MYNTLAKKPTNVMSKKLFVIQEQDSVVVVGGNGTHHTNYAHECDTTLELVDSSGGSGSHADQSIDLSVDTLEEPNVNNTRADFQDDRIGVEDITHAYDDVDISTVDEKKCGDNSPRGVKRTFSAMNEND